MGKKLNLKKENPIWILDSVENDLQRLYDHYRDVVNQNEYLRKENERLKSEAYKDEELSKMKDRYEKMKEDHYNGFPISKEEDEKIKKWMDEVYSNDPSFKDMKMGGAIGGRFVYKFVPTSVGVFGTVIDILTKKELSFQEP